MKRNVVYTAAVILTIVNLAAFGALIYGRWLNEQPSQPPDMRSQRFERMKRELALSSKQAEQLDLYRTAFHAGLDSLSTQLISVRTQLARALREQAIDTTRINGMLNDISRLQSAAQQLVISHLLTVKSMLTADQKERFFAIVLERFSSASDSPMPGRPPH